MIKLLSVIAGVLGLIVLMAMLFALPVMWLWNYLAPAFHAPELGFWQALALNVLCGLLFKPTSNSK